MDVSTPFVGHERQQSDLQSAIASGRIASAWVFSGPRGAGKASLARRFAARLLGYPAASASHPFNFVSGDPGLARLRAGGHPDMREVRREIDDKGKGGRFITVDQIREFSEFFSLTASEGAFRIGIVDAADDLNPSAANALLKTLEEPPPRSCLILVHHGDAPLLPTLRSRCRRLRFDRLTDAETGAVLRAAATDATDLERLVRIARGQPGLATALALPGLAQAGDDLVSLLDARMAEPEAVLRLGGLAQAGNAEDLEVFQRAINLRMTEWARQKLLASGEQGLGPEASIRLLNGWREAQKVFEASHTLNLAPDAALLAVVRAMREYRLV